MPDEILVVFSEQTDLWWLKHLRKGFKHCYVLIRLKDIWVCIDTLAHRTEIMRIDIPDSFQIKNWLEAQGETVVITHPHHAKEIALLPAIFSCTESVKRILGVRAPWVITPWQLYKFIKQQ